MNVDRRRSVGGLQTYTGLCVGPTTTVIPYPHNISQRSAVTVLFAFQEMNAKNEMQAAVGRLVPGQAIMVWDPSGNGKVTREVTIRRTLLQTMEVQGDSLSDAEYERYRRESPTWVMPAGSTEAVMVPDADHVPALAEPSFVAITRVGADRPLFGAYPRDTRSSKKAAEWGPVSGSHIREFWSNAGVPVRDGIMLPCVGALMNSAGDGAAFQVRAMEPETGKYATKWFQPLALAAPGVNGRMDSAEFAVDEKLVEAAIRRKQRLFLAWVPFGALAPAKLDYVPSKPLRNSPKAAEAWAEEQGEEAVRKMANEFGCPAAAKFVLEGWDALSPSEQADLGQFRGLPEMLQDHQSETASRCLAATFDPTSEIPLGPEPAQAVKKLESAARKAVASRCFTAPVGADLGF